MGKAWFLLTKLHSLAWPGLTLAYPLYASMKALEGRDTSKPEVEQWLVYWIMYALLSPLELILEPLLQWIPFWYDLKLVFVAWLVLPQFGGACFLYEKLAKDLVLRVMGRRDHRRHQVVTSRPSRPAPTNVHTSTHHQPRHQAATSRSSQPAPANARNTSAHQSDTVNAQDTSAHRSNAANDRDTSSRVGRRPIWEGENRLVHKPGNHRSLLSWSNLFHRRHIY